MAEGSESQSNNPLSRKLNKILETRLDNDKEMVEALNALSTFFVDNSLRSRRNLRGDIEKRSLAINESFEGAFRDVKQQLDAVHADIEQMSRCCTEMTSRLKSARDQTSDLISKTTTLQAESQRIQMKETVADAFISRFQLKPDEVQALKGTRNGPISETFFEALSRVKEIHNDCKLLLRTKQQTAGLQIMEAMALHLESSYEKLYRWSQDECRGLTGDLPDISNTLSRAMVALQDRPVLFKYTLDEYGTARRTAVVRCFIDALTRGGPGGTPRPIELHSHDPVRYVGDMLAWLHQAIASEKELLHSLLRNSSSTGDNVQKEILSHITEGVCRPFKVRVEQVIVSEPGAVMLFSLANILKFYGTTIGSLIDEDASVTVTILDMNALALKMFYNSLNCHASKLLEKIELPPPDLSPTESLRETMSLLRDVLTCHDASVIPLDARQADYARIISCLVDPLIQMCSMSASHLNASDMAAYMINCIHQIQSTLAVYEFTDKHIEMLAGQTEAHLDTLISEQASFILSRSGVGNLYTVYQENRGQKVALSSLHGMDPQSVKDAMAKFDKYLSCPDSLVMPQCNLLRTTRLRDTVHKRAVDAVCTMYKTLYDAIVNDSNKYPDVKTLVPRTPDQVTSLLT
ncbi:conserved oligomeric Golgi complex subunit 6-like [Stylophora pistillata]|uniref:Conserved oligomeric Golgi complex subunit 6 n=1 Tax=Stylophora pistillata TaxID=50429 RepID=A0A2B4S5A9_STYPI|nr:conserved oligomeric Golgi complex subunit 6-like [Stylophora pistillata]PFX23787.1 Conserved oligomeric Golgi complex subunit 6 [Stylophora pistillata]